MQRRVRTAANSWRTVIGWAVPRFAGVEPARVFAMLVGSSPARDGPEGVNPSPVSLMRGFRLQAEGCARRSKHGGSHGLPAEAGSHTPRYRSGGAKPPA